MSTQILRNDFAASRETGFSPLAWLKGLFAHFVQELTVRRTVNQLNTLSDRELDDIGLTRFDIELLARH